MIYLRLQKATSVLFADDTSILMTSTNTTILFADDTSILMTSTNTTILFADDTSILMTSTNTTKLQNDIKLVFKQINTWFEANLLSMNLNKTTIDTCSKYDDRQISNTTNTKFLGLFINDTASWKTHMSILYLN